eukprot:COSAG05_NODE_21466_length_271_cov_1.500000_1_plen_41_part_10
MLHLISVGNVVNASVHLRQIVHALMQPVGWKKKRRLYVEVQ